MVLNPSAPAGRLGDTTLGALLAGGSSRRMGCDKSTIDLGGRPLAAWTATTLHDLTPHCVQIGGDPVPGLGWRTLQDQRSNAGPAAGLETALLFAPGCAVVVCPVDTPLVPGSLLEALRLAIADGAVAAAPHHAGRWHPLISACSPALLPALGDWLDAGRRDLQGLFDQVDAYALHDDALAEHGDPEVFLSNINAPADFDRIRAIIDE